MKKYLTVFALLGTFAIAACSCPKENKIHFASDSYALTTEDITELDAVAKRLKYNKHDKARVFGYTDATGTKDHNMKLSQNRAVAAANYLESKGIESERITLGAFGEASPAATNATQEGRYENRRVEIHYYK